MRFFTSIASALTLVSAASAANFTVVVGKGNANVYDPTFLTGVASGDTVTFRFESKSHSVTQSTFDKPCEAKAGGVDSGFIPVEANATVLPEWTIKVENVTAPHWFFCARVPHCSSSGMVFAINPTAEKTFATFQNTAKGLAPPAGSSATPGAPAATSGAPAASNTSAPTTNSPSGAINISIQKTTSFLAVLGVIAGLTL